MEIKTPEQNALADITGDFKYLLGRLELKAGDSLKHHYLNVVTCLKWLTIATNIKIVRRRKAIQALLNKAGEISYNTAQTGRREQIPTIKILLLKANNLLSAN